MVQHLYSVCLGWSAVLMSLCTIIVAINDPLLKKQIHKKTKEGI